MGLEEQQQDAPKRYLSRTPFLRKLGIGLGLVVLTVYWACQSFPRPGGIPHGPDLALLSHTSMHPEMAVAVNDDDCDLHDPNQDPLPAIRTAFGSQGTLVFGWPSTGGVWVHSGCYGVELDFLGLSRFEVSPTERFSPAEDAFCQRMEMIGARFYETESAFNKQSSSYDNSEFHTWYGWPASGGIWALRARTFEEAELGISRIRNALSMEERCKAIEMLGGTFFERWEDVEWQGAGERAP